MEIVVIDGKLLITLRGAPSVLLEPGTILRPFQGNEEYPEGGLKGIWKGQQSCMFRMNDIIGIRVET